MARMITEERDMPTGKSVLLFSGGMDSVMLNHLCQPDVLLVLPHGQKYQDRELDCISYLVNRGHVDASKIHIDVCMDLSKHERDDAIIPARNAHFILLAALYGEDILLGSVAGDRSRDKSEAFFSAMTVMLNVLYTEQHWCGARQFKVHSPYKTRTKTQLVAHYLEERGSAQALLDSYSCYEGGHLPCGWCKPCFRKWVALRNNDIPLPRVYFARPPQDAPWLQALMPQIQSGTYRGAEDQEILDAINK